MNQDEPLPPQGAPDTGGETPANARQEVAETRPGKAPLADAFGPAAFSPVDLPEPEGPLERPLTWTMTVFGVAAIVLALFNADAIRGWSYELEPTPFNQRIVDAAEGWHDATARLGLERPVETMRGWWRDAQALRFEGEEKGPDAAAPEPPSS